jgi:hypothetical protein
MRKRNRVILAVIGYIVFFFCVEGWGAAWYCIEIDSDGNALLLDAASISRQPNNIVRAWSKKIYSRKAVNEWVKDVGEKYKDLSYSITLVEYHCTEKKMRILTTTFYSSGGGVIGESPPDEWMFIVPDSKGEVLFEEVCKQPK